VASCYTARWLAAITAAISCDQAVIPVASFSGKLSSLQQLTHVTKLTFKYSFVANAVIPLFYLTYSTSTVPQCLTYTAASWKAVIRKCFSCRCCHTSSAFPGHAVIHQHDLVGDAATLLIYSSYKHYFKSCLQLFHLYSNTVIRTAFCAQNVLFDSTYYSAILRVFLNYFHIFTSRPVN
jgi:hypothetical protein